MAGRRDWDADESCGGAGVSAVIGIDPSLTATGVATESGAWTITTKAGDPKRLQTIYQRLNATLASAWGDGLAVIEDLPTNAHGAGLTGMAQGVIRLAAINCGLPYVTVPAATLKKYATGKGNATKADMRMAWFQRAGEDVRDDNQVDALWLRQIGLALIDDVSVIQMPKPNRLTRSGRSSLTRSPSSPSSCCLRA